LSSHFVESKEELALSALYSNYQQKHFICFIIFSSKRLFHAKTEVRSIKLMRLISQLALPSPHLEGTMIVMWHKEKAEWMIAK
jgi:hypothetical protein